MASVNSPPSSPSGSRWATETRDDLRSCATCPWPQQPSSTAAVTSTCGPTLSSGRPAAAWPPARPVRSQQVAHLRAGRVPCPVSVRPATTTAAAAAISGAEAEVPPLSTVSTCLRGAAPWCGRRPGCRHWARTRRCGSRTRRRTSPEPLVRVAAQVPLCAGSPFCGGTARVSSRVVPPTAMAPLSRTWLGVVESASSLMSVVLARVAGDVGRGAAAVGADRGRRVEAGAVVGGDADDDVVLAARSRRSPPGRSGRPPGSGRGSPARRCRSRGWR